MQRNALEKLKDWKNHPKRKPLIIQGARQVGKTWLMKYFGETAFANVAYINFDNNSRMQALFSADFDLQRILLGLSIETGQTIDKNNTLIIFDEIQEVPQALTSLKYFYENAPDYHIVSAGSLLGVALHQGVSFPVGKVDFLSIYPMDFSEFLLAMGDKPLADLLKLRDWALITAMKSKYIERLRQYYFVGGMPEAVQSFADRQDVTEVRHIQNNLLSAYEQDFSKHINEPITVARVRALWNAVPSQLAKENKKFVFNQVKKGSRLKDFEIALQWLSDCGLIYPVYRISKPHLPLTAYQDNAFKLFYLDVGLLGAKSALPAPALLDGNRLFTEFKGALTEQYVLQQLLTCANNQHAQSVYYWATTKGTAEVDFVIQHEKNEQNHPYVLPIEVKAEENLKAKSLKVFVDKYCQQQMAITGSNTALRFSMADYRQEQWLTNVPLYAVMSVFKS